MLHTFRPDNCTPEPPNLQTPEPPNPRHRALAHACSRSPWTPGEPFRAPPPPVRRPMRLTLRRPGNMLSQSTSIFIPRSPVPPRVLNCPGHQVAWTIKYVVRLGWGGGWTHRITSSLVYLCKARTCSSGLAHCRGLRRARPRFRTLGSASSFQRKLHLTVCVLLPLPSPPLPSFSAMSSLPVLRGVAAERIAESL